MPWLPSLTLLLIVFRRVGCTPRQRRPRRPPCALWLPPMLGALPPVLCSLGNIPSSAWIRYSVFVGILLTVYFLFSLVGMVPVTLRSPGSLHGHTSNSNMN